MSCLLTKPAGLMRRNETFLKVLLRKKILPGISARASWATGHETCHQPHHSSLLGSRKVSALHLEVSPGDLILERQCSSQQKMPYFLDRIIMRAELWHDVLMPTLFSRSQSSFPSLSLFSCCNSSEQPSPPRGTNSHSPGALPCTCACLHPFFRLMTAAEGLPAAFQGINTSLPVGRFSVDTGWAWLVSPKHDEVSPQPGTN